MDPGVRCRLSGRFGRSLIGCRLVGTSTMNASSAATLFGEVNVPRPPASHPSRLSGLVQQFNSSAELLNADVVLPVRALSMVESGEIVVPGRGSFAMTAWAKRQLAARLSIPYQTFIKEAWAAGLPIVLGRLEAEQRRHPRKGR